MKLMTSQAENPMEKTEFCRPDDECERLSKPVKRKKCVSMQMMIYVESINSVPKQMMMNASIGQELLLEY